MRPPAPAAGVPGHREFSTTNSDEGIHHLMKAYRTTLQVRGARNGYLFRHDRADAGSLALDEVRLPLDLRIRQAPLDSLVIVRIDAGRVERECGGVSERFFAGDIFVDAEPGLPATLRLVDARLETVMLNLDVLAQVAATSVSRPAGPVRLTSYQPKSPAAACQWQRTVTLLRDLLVSSEVAAGPLISGNAARLVAATVLTLFPNNVLSDPTAQDRRDSTSATVRRAIAFIEEHADTDISVADIAAGAHVSIRAVQVAFRRHHDTTPMAYLRSVRLERAHRDLVSADPSRGGTVSDISNRWGFYSQSKFAARYRQAYGVTPSHTLHS